MDKFETLCPGCFADKNKSVVCPHCRYDEGQLRSPMALPHRTLLHRQYLVGRVLGSPGGFGITYLGWDVKLETRVAIKEFLPSTLASRDTNSMTVVPHSKEAGEVFNFGMQQFLQEARILAKFNHPNLVRVRNFFEENDTTYLVMDYYEGNNLAELLNQKGGRLPEATAIQIMVQILDGLRHVHSKGLLHRDIKPQNIYLTHKGQAILLDFGAARVAMGERSRSLTVVMTPGFAPLEQYHRRGQQGPWTDIYACAATLFYIVTGEAPIEATERVKDDAFVSLKQVAGTMSTALYNCIAAGAVTGA